MHFAATHKCLIFIGRQQSASFELGIMTIKVGLTYPTTLCKMGSPQISRIRLFADTRYYGCGNMLYNCCAHELRTAQIGLGGAVWSRSKCVKLGIPWGLCFPRKWSIASTPKRGKKSSLSSVPIILTASRPSIGLSKRRWRRPRTLCLSIGPRSTFYPTVQSDLDTAQARLPD